MPLALVAYTKRPRCLLAAAVPTGGAPAFLIGKHRYLREDQILRLMALGVLILVCLSDSR